MKCVICGKEGVSYDGISEMFYCEECGSLYSAEEKEKREHKHKKQKEVNKEQVKEKDLSLFSHVVLNTTQSIPILNILIPIVVGCSEMPNEDRKYYLSRFISQLFIIMCLICVYAVFISDSRDYRLEQFHKLTSVINSKFVSINDDRLSIEDRGIPISALKNIEIVSPEPESKYLESIEMFDDATVKGSTLLELIYDIYSDDLAILIQTKQIANRYGKTTYRNYGLIIDGTIYKVDSPCYIKTEFDEVTPMTDDYGKTLSVELSDLENTKSIFKISEDNKYNIKCLYENDSLIGIVITESK